MIRFANLLCAALAAFTLSAPLVPAPSAAQEASKSPSLRQRIAARLEVIVKETGVPGISVGYVMANGETGAASAGVSDVERSTLLRPKDLLLAGSIGKTFAAAVLLQHVDAGKLDLDAPISRYIGNEPWFDRLPNAKTLTLRSLMRHESGIREHVASPKFVDALRSDPDRAWKPEDIIEFALDQPPLSEVGKGWSYADTNFIVAGFVFEKVMRRTILSEIQSKLLKPLGLKQTRPSDRRSIPGLATGYSMPNSPFPVSGAVLKDGKLFINPQMEWTGGGFASTPRDLARWAKALYEGDVISPKMKTEMLKGVAARTGRGDKYGLGVQIRESAFGPSCGHGGWFPGYLSEMEYFPDHKLAVAVQINTDDMAKLRRRPRALVAEIAGILLGKNQP